MAERGNSNLLAEFKVFKGEVGVKLDRAIADIAQVRMDMAKTIDILQENKIDKSEVYRMREGSEKIHDDFEDRLRVLEQIVENFKGRNLILGIFGLAIMNALISWAINSVR